MKLLRIDDTTINLDHVIRVERGLGYLEVYFDLLDPINMVAYAIIFNGEAAQRLASYLNANTEVV